MSWVKLNQFHWHIVDSQSFPLALSSIPQLAQQGAYSSASIYTEQDVLDIIRYASERGIDVLLEIDTPGHTSVISKAFPEHIACAESTPWSQFANGECSKLTTEITYFLITKSLFRTSCWPITPCEPCDCQLYC